MGTEWKKYPRTPHLPFSETIAADDKKLNSIKHFIGREVVVTEKMDGEGSTIYNNGLHARSLNNTYHSSRAWLKALQAMIAPQIPDDMRITGENVYAKHTIHYQSLSSYFYVYGIFENGYCLPWDDIEELCKYFKYSLKVHMNIWVISIRIFILRLYRFYIVAFGMKKKLKLVIQVNLYTVETRKAMS